MEDERPLRTEQTMEKYEGKVVDIPLATRFMPFFVSEDFGKYDYIIAHVLSCRI